MATCDSQVFSCALLQLRRRVSSRIGRGGEHTLNSTEGASNGLPVQAVTESGLYSLILGSRKPEAKAFKRWVTHEVLPAIRKTGRYEIGLSPTEQLLAQAKRLVGQERRQQILRRGCYFRFNVLTTSGCGLRSSINSRSCPRTVCPGSCTTPSRRARGRFRRMLWCRIAGARRV